MSPEARLSRSVLHASFGRAWQALGAHAEPGPVLERLLAAHGEPQRKYHTLQHLAECLDHFQAARELAARPAEVEIALWFHDAVYAIGRSDNEEKSARWAGQALEAAGVAPDAIERVHALVTATRHQEPPAGRDPDRDLIVDVDLAILGAPPERFAEYERQIREEYATVPTWLFRRKRRQLLRGFLARPRIYGTEHFREALEERARENLRRAVS